MKRFYDKTANRKWTARCSFVLFCERDKRKHPVNYRCNFVQSFAKVYQ